MVLYALVSDASIGYLFLGGILPGLFMGAVLMVDELRGWRAARGFGWKSRCRCASCRG